MVKYAALLILALVLFCSCGKNPQDAAPTKFEIENALLKVRELAFAADNAAVEKWKCQENIDDKGAAKYYHIARQKCEEALNILDNISGNYKDYLSKDRIDEINQFRNEISNIQDKLRDQP
jgi:hypothetical protein